MTSSENLASMEPWGFRLPFADSWISEAFARDTETLTKALQKSLSAAAAPAPLPHLDPFSFGSGGGGGGGLFEAQTPTVSGVSGVSGSDPETATKRRSAAATAKIAKRRSRASKRTQTTFITADPANFRQMVQQVTGVRFGNLQLPVAPPVVKPEPHRPSNSSHHQGCLPTLDTSAYLLDQHQHMVGPSASSAAAAASQEHLSIAFPPAADGASAAFDFDGFGGFPTLESWKAV